jgi:AcrR family transcriptional regulator
VLVTVAPGYALRVPAEDVDAVVFEREVARAHRLLESDGPTRVELEEVEAILDTALAVIDADGLDGLTVRRLADELGTSHAALYRHVGSHQEIVVLLVDRVLGRIELEEDPADSPRSSAERALRRYRSVLLEHPALAPAFLQGQLLGPNALAAREEGLRRLVEAGADPALAARAFLTLTHLAITSAVFETSGAGRSSDERAAMQQLFTQLPADEFPTVIALATDLNATEGTDEFEFALAALLDHIERSIGAAGTAGWKSGPQTQAGTLSASSCAEVHDLRAHVPPS